jgi:hypothetical protein
MKNLKILFLSLLFYAPIFSQEVDTVGLSAFYKYLVQNNVKFEFQNWEKNDYSYPSGSYYRFTGKIEYKDGKKHIIGWEHLKNPEMLIGFLIGKGIPVKEVWYKASESNCHGFQIVVSASLLIRTDREIDQEFITVFGFEKIEPFGAPGGCPYNIRHYIFN